MNSQIGQIKLPRFQRLKAWDRKSVTSFLNTIINNLPVGVTLVLDVAAKEKFESRYFNLPYLSLPSDTGRDVALQVFINVNTNGEPLTLYDIVVAEVESIAGKSLRDLEAELQVTCE